MKYVYMQQMHDILRISLSYPLNNELSYMYVPAWGLQYLNIKCFFMIHAVYEGSVIAC